MHRRLLVADDSVKRLAIVAPDGSLEWELKIGAIHDAQLLPNGNILTQLGWQRASKSRPTSRSSGSTTPAR
ncbi:MAG: hypothetical protein HC788_02470 [Sphingopyxis sp.]|nr:hypothetical protein [Sphingopyxis sp.]